MTGSGLGAAVVPGGVAGSLRRFSLNVRASPVDGTDGDSDIVGGATTGGDEGGGGTTTTGVAPGVSATETPPGGP